MSANIIITGASGGIGSAIARAFSAEGRLFLVGNHREEALRSLTEELKKNGCEARYFCADLSTAEGCAAVFQEYDQFFGAPDLLVNNAMFPRFRIRRKRNFRLSFRPISAPASA